MGKEEIAPINRSEAEVAMRRLAWLNQSLPELVEWFNQNPGVERLYCFRLFSLEEGLKRLEAFLPEMRKAMQAHAKGEPYNASSTKARSSKKTDKQSVSKEIKSTKQRIKAARKKNTNG